MRPLPPLFKRKEKLKDQKQRREVAPNPQTDMHSIRMMPVRKNREIRKAEERSEKLSP